MRRFFFDPQNRNNDTVTLSEEESRHIVRVLRLKSGAAVELLDGTGTLYDANLTETGRRVTAHITGVSAKIEQSSKRLWVRQAMLKGEKMDLVIQKCTELGVTGMTPFHSSRCQGKLDPKQVRKKQERWQRISLASCKQCLRLQPMQLDQSLRYDEFMAPDLEKKCGVKLLFWEEEKKVHLQDIEAIVDTQCIDLLFGPEGGLSPQEIELARAQGWQTVSLGDRILRAETATISGVAIVQHLAGNLQGQGN